jgi:hypothetical protein
VAVRRVVNLKTVIEVRLSRTELVLARGFPACLADQVTSPTEFHSGGFFGRIKVYEKIIFDSIFNNNFNSWLFGNMELY